MFAALDYTTRSMPLDHYIKFKHRKAERENEESCCDDDETNIKCFNFQECFDRRSEIKFKYIRFPFERSEAWQS